MKYLPPFLAMALVLAAGAVRAVPVEHGKAAQHCEDAVAAAIERLRGKEVHDVQFVGATRAITTDGDDIGVKGEGHYRRAAAIVPFDYSCAFNQTTGGTSGVVFREIGNAAAAEQAPWQPDLTNVSPEACETAVAALLKDQHPRVAGISFRSDTRRLQPAGGARVGLEGQGTLQRAPGMNPNAFRYHCEFDPRSGKVVTARAVD
jgi:copper chaperone CopZ